MRKVFALVLVLILALASAAYADSTARTLDEIKESGEIIILLGVRKGESLTRMKTITAREIEGKLLNMHNDIPNAYVYNPITEIPNDLVWEFL